MTSGNGGWNVGVAADAVVDELEFDGESPPAWRIVRVRNATSVWRATVDRTPARDVARPIWRYYADVVETLLRDGDSRAKRAAAWLIERTRPGAGTRVLAAAAEFGHADVVERMVARSGRGAFDGVAIESAMRAATNGVDGSRGNERAPRRPVLERLVRAFGWPREPCFHAARMVERETRTRGDASPSDSWMRDALGMHVFYALPRCKIGGILPVPNGRAEKPRYTAAEIRATVADGRSTFDLFGAAVHRGMLDEAARLYAADRHTAFLVDDGYTTWRWLTVALCERGRIDALRWLHANVLASRSEACDFACAGLRLAFAYDRVEVVEYLVPAFVSVSSALQTIEAFGNFSALAWARAHGAARSLAWHEANRQ